MPPKKKGSSKKPPKVKTPILMDGLTKDEMTRDQMVGYAARLQEELDRVREEKKSFKQERDQYLKFLGITERELNEVEADLKNQQKGIEEDTRCHQEEIQVIKQEMKFHLCQHQNTISALKADALVSTEAAQEEQQQLELELHEKIWTIKRDIKKLNLESHESHVKELELAQDKEMTEAKDHLEKQRQDTNIKNKNKLEQLKQELETKMKKTIRDVKNRWEHHVSELRGDHKEAINELHKLMEELRMESSDYAKHCAKIEAQIKAKAKDMPHILQDKKRITQHISEVGKDIAALERQLKYKVKKNDAEMVRLEELADLERKHEALEQKFRKLQLKRDELYNAVPLKLQEVHQKADQRGEVLERKLSALAEHQESTWTQLDAVLSNPNMDQTALRGIMNQVEEKLDTSGNYIKDLKHKIALITKSRKDLLQQFEATQRAVGVPVQELHVEHGGSSPAGKSL
ncbi:dynein regulatory complex subunit 4-like [Halichoeres trimaculatus]|uniref:dynein regulatory complex subunit 4-like n=1 Tax=Halichoeres trimaculatus TaxID=147232 RepID=UPI003D9DC4A1